MSKRRVCVIGARAGDWNKTLGEDYECVVTQSTDFDLLSTCDMLLISGGADVNPDMYGQTQHPNTSYSDIRDDLDSVMYDAAKRLKMPIVGVCRGAQILNVLEGGTLIQHTTGHTTHHEVETKYGSRFEVTSTHHQMMFPTMRGEILAWANSISQKYEINDREDNQFFRKEMQHPRTKHIQEPEVVLYADSKALCVQYHPEYMVWKVEDPDKVYAVRYFRTQVNRLFQEKV